MIMLVEFGIAPVLVVLSSLAGRRWGPGVTGAPVALPEAACVAEQRASVPSWDLPARALATAALVVAVTGAAGAVGRCTAPPFERRQPARHQLDPN